MGGELGLYQTPISGDIVPLARNVADSDAVLVPHDAFYFSENIEYLGYLRQIAKRNLLIYSDRGDFPKKPIIKNSVALRVALNPGESNQDKIVVPYNVESLEDLNYRSLEEVPRVSFVGYVPKVFGRRTLLSLIQTPTHPLTGNGALVRKGSVAQLEKMEIEKVIIKRNTYGGHVKTVTNLFSSRKEYIESIQNSDFVLCPRGDANQSARFYEILSCGRIPLIPNSGIVFPRNISENTPFDITMDVGFSAFRAGSMEKSIRETWGTYSSNSDYLKHQHQLRKLFREYLNFNNYLKSLFHLNLDSFLHLASTKSN